MTFVADIQRLEPGAEVVLFELDARSITGGGEGDIIRFHGRARRPATHSFHAGGFADMARAWLQCRARAAL